jgi:hypothetical protein
LSQHSATSRSHHFFSDRAQKLDSVFGFPADYELLFETALGIYDYDIARAVLEIRRWIKSVPSSSETIRSTSKFYGRYEVDLESNDTSQHWGICVLWCGNRSD